MSNRAWVTLATNDSYGLGALVLAHSLRRVSSAYPAVVLITPSVTEPMRERLRAIFAEVIIVDVLDSGDAAHLALLQRPELGITFTKIHCWNLTQYEKCVFLDADTLIVQNCDELFEREQLSAAPDVGWPDCFNSGVFVYTPSADTFSQLIAFAQERGSFDGGDQGLLNSFFSDWARGDINKHLPFLYNVTSAAFYSYLPALKQFGQDLKIIHFIGAAKPWLQQYNFESGTIDTPEHIRGLLQLWWDLFASQVHGQLDTGMVEVEESHEVPAIPPQDISQEYHYQPTLDPLSEFAWHHPNAQTKEEIHENQLDISEFFDPWDIYKGHIPTNSENETIHNSELERFGNQEGIRKYAWDYQAQKQNELHRQRTHHTNLEWEQQHRVQTHQTSHHWQDHPQQHEKSSYHIDQHSQQHTEQHNIQTFNTDIHWHYEPQQNNNQTHHWQQHNQQQNIQTDHHWPYHNTHNSEYNWQQCSPKSNTEILQSATENWQPFLQQHDQIDHTNQHWQNYFQQQGNQNNHTNNNWQQNQKQNDDHGQKQDHNKTSDSDWHTKFKIQQYNTQIQVSDNVHQSSQQLEQHWQYHSQHGDSSHNHNHHVHDHLTQTQHLTDHQSNIFNHTYQDETNYITDKQQHAESKHNHENHTIHENISVHHVQVENTKKRNRHKRKLRPIDIQNDRGINGNISESESDVSEEIVPRHPYDEFYLRHRVTIDSRGRKICSHEIPPTPSPSPSPEPALRIVCNDDDYEYISSNNCEVQSGVAGNLARVLPGAAGQREALDELTRRQGWEAGNIDYMGADSFDNIWAKISQTLSKPRISPPKQQSPPKEIVTPQPTPEQIEVQSGEVAKEPVSDQVEVAKEAVPVELPAPVDAVTPFESACTGDKVAPTATQVDSLAQAVAPAEPAIPIETAAVVETVPKVETAPCETPVGSEAPEVAKEVASLEPAICPAKTEVPAAVEVVTPVGTSPAEISTPSADSETTAKVPPVETVPIAVTVEAPAPREEVAPVDSTTSEIPTNTEVLASAEAVVPVEAAIVAKVQVPAVQSPAATESPTVSEIPSPNSIPVAVESTEDEIPTTVKEALAEVSVTSEEVKIDESVPAADPVKVGEQPEQKTETTVEKKESVPVAEPIASQPTIDKPSETDLTPESTVKGPSAAAPLEATPEKPTLEADTDSPPLVNTPSKEDELDVTAVKSEERRKPAGKLKLVPPAAADPLPTPDSELEDAASLAQSIIASELRTPTVTSPESAVSPVSPISPLLAPAIAQTLAVEEPEVPTPPVGAVSLAQIGVKSTPKGKSTTAAQIESSIESPPLETKTEAPTSTVESTPVAASETSKPISVPTPVISKSTPVAGAEASTPTPAAPTDAPKKKIVKKVVKKEAGATGADAPVPPPRKKEKKPKEK